MSLYEQLRDPRFAPPPLVERMISAGHLGRKTGRGFYTLRRGLSRDRRHRPPRTGGGPRLRRDGRRHRAGVRAGGARGRRAGRRRGATSRPAGSGMARFLAGGVERGKVAPEERDAALERVARRARAVRPRRRRRGDRGRRRGPRAQAGRCCASVAHVVGEKALIATNTSALAVAGPRGRGARPRALGGLHFFNPAPVMSSSRWSGGRHRARDDAHAGGPRAADRQGAGRHQGPPRLPRQPPADALPQPGRPGPTTKAWRAPRTSTPRWSSGSATRWAA